MVAPFALLCCDARAYLLSSIVGQMSGVVGTNVMIRARAAFEACRFDENPHGAVTQGLDEVRSDNCYPMRACWRHVCSAHPSHAPLQQVS